MFPDVVGVIRDKMMKGYKTCLTSADPTKGSLQHWQAKISSSSVTFEKKALDLLPSYHCNLLQSMLHQTQSDWVKIVHLHLILLVKSLDITPMLKISQKMEENNKNISLATWT